MVVVVRERLHDLARSAQPERRADEHVLRAFTHEGVDELLRRRAVDLVRAPRPPQPAVEPRVVDVRVEPVLVRGVPDPAEARPEVAAARAREVADPDARRLGVR